MDIFATIKFADKFGGWYAVPIQVSYELGKIYMKTLAKHPEYTPYPYHGFQY